MKVLIIAFALVLFVGYAAQMTESNKQKVMIENAVRTSNIIQIDDKYYEVLPYNFEECATTEGECVLTIIPTNHGNRLYNMSTKNTSKYKQGYYEGLNEGVHNGWDLCYYSDKTKRAMGAMP